MPSLEVTDQERQAYPTYKVAKRVVNGDMTAPVEFFGWTVLRSLILMPGLAIGGVRGWNIVTGALAGSTLVSCFALYRTYATKKSIQYAERRQLAGPGYRRVNHRRSTRRRR